MPMSKEERREYNKQYYHKNRDKAQKVSREYRANNRDKMNEYNKQYRINKNQDKVKKYRKTENHKKSVLISGWKRQGILCFDYNLLYDIFLSTSKCEYCNINFTQDHSASSRCLDHDHNITDKFNVRGVLCRSCNCKDVLREEPTT